MNTNKDSMETKDRRVVLSTLWIFVQPLHYRFFATIEIACTSFIVWYAWKWPAPEGQARKIALGQGELAANS